MSSRAARKPAPAAPEGRAAEGPDAPILHDFRASDPEEFLSGSPRGVRHQMTVQGRGRFEASRRRFASRGMIVSRGRTSLGVTHRTGTGDYAFFTLVEDDAPPSSMNGLRFAGGTIVLCRAGAEVHSQTPGGGAWWNLCFPPARLDHAWTALFGTAPPARPGIARVAPISPGRRAELFAGIAVALSGVGSDLGPTLSDGLLRLALEPFGPPEDGRDVDRATASARRLGVVNGLVALAEAVDEPLSLLEVCARLGVAARSLNAFSNAVLGMSAGAYLRRRRLHRVLARLRSGEAASVTEAATRHGFWELGRFAAEYGAVFGETPSATLRSARARA